MPAAGRGRCAPGRSRRGRRGQRESCCWRLLCRARSHLCICLAAWVLQRGDQGAGGRGGRRGQGSQGAGNGKGGAAGAGDGAWVGRARRLQQQQALPCVAGCRGAPGATWGAAHGRAKGDTSGRRKGRRGGNCGRGSGSGGGSGACISSSSSSSSASCSAALPPPLALASASAAAAAATAAVVVQDSHGHVVRALCGHHAGDARRDGGSGSGSGKSSRGTCGANCRGLRSAAAVTTALAPRLPLPLPHLPHLNLLQRHVSFAGLLALTAALTAALRLGLALTLVLALAQGMVWKAASRRRPHRGEAATKRSACNCSASASASKGRGRRAALPCRLPRPLRGAAASAPHALARPVLHDLAQGSALDKRVELRELVCSNASA